MTVGPCRWLIGDGGRKRNRKMCIPKAHVRWWNGQILWWRRGKDLKVVVRRKKGGKRLASLLASSMSCLRSLSEQWKESFRLDVEVQNTPFIVTTRTKLLQACTHMNS